MKNKVLKKLQKILFYAFLIASCGVLISSFCFFSNGWSQFQVEGTIKPGTVNFYNEMNSFYFMIHNVNSPNNLSVVFSSIEEARNFYYEFWYKIQSTNNWLFALGISGVVGTALMAIAGNFHRKKYYLINLISSCVTGFAGILISIVTIVKSGLLISDINMIMPDVEVYKSLKEQTGGTFTPISSSNCAIGIIVPILMIIFCAGIVAYTVYKYIDSQKQIKMEAVSSENE